MNNEPVAYVSTTGLNDIEWTDASHSLNYGDALYTHPVNTCKHGVDDGACKECYITETINNTTATMLRQQADRIAELQEFAIWMTGCGYDFTQHEHFNKCRDKLLKGNE